MTVKRKSLTGNLLTTPAVAQVIRARRAVAPSARRGPPVLAPTDRHTEWSSRARLPPLRASVARHRTDSSGHFSGVSFDGRRAPWARRNAAKWPAKPHYLGEISPPAPGIT